MYRKNIAHKDAQDPHNVGVEKAFPHKEAAQDRTRLRLEKYKKLPFGFTRLPHKAAAQGRTRPHKEAAQGRRTRPHKTRPHKAAIGGDVGANPACVCACVRV
jgi:hypothetical protein